jgi:hypothetical protein
LIKRILITFFVLIAIFATYWIYCEIFWKNYHKEKWENDYDFHSLTKFPEDSTLTKDNFQNYTWTREIEEPMHGQWINKTTILFSSDTTMDVTVRSGYIHKNYFYYPIFREFISQEYTLNESYKFDKSKMRFPSRWPDGDSLITIQLNKTTLTINYSFL